MNDRYSGSIIAWFIFSFFTFTPSLAYSDETIGKENSIKDRCISLHNEKTAALVADDWENLDRLAREYIKKCKGVFDADWLSGAYENIALANNSRGKFKSALIASESCVKAYYGSPGCHIEKAKALMSIGKISEAKEALDISEKLAGHALEGAQWNFNHARSELDKELYTSYISRYESSLELINYLRTKLAQ